MAAAEVLRLTPIVYKKVTTVINGKSKHVSYSGNLCRTCMRWLYGKDTKKIVQRLASCVDDKKCL